MKYEFVGFVNPETRAELLVSPAFFEELLRSQGFNEELIHELVAQEGVKHHGIVDDAFGSYRKALEALEDSEMEAFGRTLTDDERDSLIKMAQLQQAEISGCPVAPEGSSSQPESGTSLSAVSDLAHQREIATRALLARIATSESRSASPLPSYAGSPGHRDSDPNRAAEMNISYQRELAKWKALPFFRRLLTRRPERPTGI